MREIAAFAFRPVAGALRTPCGQAVTEIAGRALKQLCLVLIESVGIACRHDQDAIHKSLDVDRYKAGGSEPGGVQMVCPRSGIALRRRQIVQRMRPTARTHVRGQWRESSARQGNGVTGDSDRHARGLMQTLTVIPKADADQWVTGMLRNNPAHALEQFGLRLRAYQQFVAGAEHLQHPAGTAAGLGEMLRVAGNGELLPPQREQVAAPRLALLEIERFGKEIRSACLERAIAQIRIIHNRDNDDRDTGAGRYIVECLDKRNSVDVGHAVIHEDQIGLIVPQPCECLLRMTERAHGEVVREIAGHPLEDTAVGGLVVDDYDVRHAMGTRPRRQRYGCREPDY
jgi:hypothetical protein